MTKFSPSKAEGDSRTWPGALAVMAVAALFALGLPAINARLPGTKVEPANVEIDLGQGVTVRTPSGWSLDLAKTKPGDTLALSRDTSSLVATAFAWTGSEAELIERTQTLLQKLAQMEVRGSPESIKTAQGLAAETYPVYSEHFDGRVWVGVLPGGKAGFAVRVRSVTGQGDTALQDAQAVVNSLKFREKP